MNRAETNLRLAVTGWIQDHAHEYTTVNALCDAAERAFRCAGAGGKAPFDPHAHWVGDAAFAALRTSQASDPRRGPCGPQDP